MLAYSTYIKLAEMFKVPPRVCEKVAKALANIDENFKKAISIEEFDTVMSDVGKFIVEITDDVENFNAVCKAINLYAFCLALERRMEDVGIENVKASLSDAFKLKDFISGIKLPQAPIYHHPLIRTIWLDMEPLIMLKLSEIVDSMAREIWKDRF